MTSCTLYLRLSDFRDDDEGSDNFGPREARLRAKAAELGWDVGNVVVENDVTPTANGRGRPASAFKRKKIVTPSGRVKLRTIRPGFRSIIDDLAAGRIDAMLCEDLDRAARDPRDMEDLIDAVAIHGASALSLSGTLKLTDGGEGGEIDTARIMVTMANKSSRDTSRRVKAKKGDLAQAGAYFGGRRPFGYHFDPDAPKYHKTLIQVEDEAAEIRNAADAIMQGTTLKAVARDLRERGVPTVTGAKWTPATVRYALLKPSVAGLVPAAGKLVKATWKPILEREEWEALSAKLSDATMSYTGRDGREYSGPRKTSTGNEPRWLLSGLARCWCGGSIRAMGSGKNGHGLSYTCTAHSHLRRQAAGADAVVLGAVARYIEEKGPDTLLLPAARPGVDVNDLRAEEERLIQRGKAQMRMHNAGEISDDELRAGSLDRKARLDEIRGQLKAATEPDPLEEFRGQRDPVTVLESLPLARKRAVVRLLVSVTLLPSRRGNSFDKDSVGIEAAERLS